MQCELDYKHEPEWCPACWDERRQVQSLRVQKDIAKEMRRANDLKEWELAAGDTPRPQRTYYQPPERTPEKVVAPPIKRRGL